ncbi:hypothetical protein DKX38_008747 [Salix brachista]|uniref:Endonuclease/exonuclease/phosphatase domain-containing protein n=1 Tax=Salix brachista TaxID=2182728 RepID=A0A5N5MBI8_9ROSI|nr:hypothetical protein DKX38_008747 [Salix brachista]
METRVLLENQIIVERGLKLPNWTYMSNGSDSVVSRILVGWDPKECHVICVDCDQQWVTCHIRFLRQDINLTVTFIYGLHTAAERQRIWDYISIHSSLINTAWLLMGDFNSTLKASDSVGGDITWGGRKLDFGNCLSQAQLFSLPYKGPRFTWHNGQDSPNTIVKKLDWAITHDQSTMGDIAVQYYKSILAPNIPCWALVQFRRGPFGWEQAVFVFRPEGGVQACMEGLCVWAFVGCSGWAPYLLLGWALPSRFFHALAEKGVQPVSCPALVWALL